jgi:SsrA-binding protein
MKILAKNKRAKYDYEITEKLVAGLVLSGGEVKSTKAGHISLKGSYVTVKDNEAWLTNAHITPYAYAGGNKEEPARPRKLLLHRNQIDSLLGARSGGIVAVPLAVLEDRGLIKVEIGFGRGKKKYDKREVIKKRDTEREAERRFKA